MHRGQERCAFLIVYIKLLNKEKTILSIFAAPKFVYSEIIRKFATDKYIDVMEATVFNPLQIHLLQMFALDKSQNGLNELKDVLYRYYSAKMEDRLDTLWQSGKLNQERLDEINEMDLHKLK